MYPVTPALWAHCTAHRGSVPCDGGERHMCGATSQKLPQSSLKFICVFLLQLISRVQNHEGFCQEKVLGQVKTEHKVTGGCGLAPPTCSSLARPPLL